MVFVLVIGWEVFLGEGVFSLGFFMWVGSCVWLVVESFSSWGMGVCVFKRGFG